MHPRLGKRAARRRKNPLDDYLQELEKYEEGTTPKQAELEDCTHADK